MDAKLYVSRLSGVVKVPPSKSTSHRAVLCAGLATGTSTVTNIEYSDDIRATLRAVRQLGAKVVEGPDSVTITGRGSSDGFVTVTRPVDCGESGSTLRFVLPLFSLTAQKVRFVGRGRLMSRPQDIYRMLFECQGLRFEQSEEGISIFGQLRPGGFTLPGDISSQFISGLLFAAPLMDSPSSIEVRQPFESRSYVNLTIEAMQHFGVKVSERERKDGSVMYRISPQMYHANDYTVEGDYSQAAFMAVLGGVLGNITLTGLTENSEQGDRVIFEILERCGARMTPVEGGVRFDRSLLRATEIDLSDCPDLGPVLFVLGCFCSGTTVIRNAGRLRIKESDRIEAMQIELSKMGARIEVDGDTISITGTVLHPSNEPLYGHNDHRIVMALAVAAYAASVPALICGAEAVNKSWPAFFDVLKSLNAKVVLDDGRA